MNRRWRVRPDSKYDDRVVVYGLGSATYIAVLKTDLFRLADALVDSAEDEHPEEPTQEANDE